ncbi:hypothetical protein [Flectobacillus rivi]|uniref:Uncharacterized protein n=1 Tax=Flectobacillus rivi TaxID=2984209 RepID=A0ABT6YYZ8_9BACT|nr:hypothetical protein [Flectobacillus rivi]MDI9874058.1 hypothetical protein [Flectobacillus rivi]
MKELQNILPIELEEAFSSAEFENDGGLEICSIEYLENELLFNFSFYLDELEERQRQYWQLKVNGYIESKIDNFGNFMTFYSEHNLLAEFQDVETELYFKRKGDYPELLLTSIFELHTIVFDNLIPIEKFIQERQLFQLCKSETGLFAKGPKSILSFYFDMLQKAGKEPYYFGERKPQFWNGQKWAEYNSDLKLVLSGGTYIIGEEFNFMKLNR